MFDDVNKNNASAPQGADAKKSIEDIFSETEKPSFADPPAGRAGATAGKPEVFQPKNKDDAGIPPEAAKGEPKIDTKKYLILFAIALGIIILAFASYWAYSVFFNPANPNLKNEAENIETDGNDQAIAPQQEGSEAQEKAATQPAQPQDSDKDGLTDTEEAELGTSSAAVDSDDDGLFDREEVKVYKTDPLNADTDGDGFLDGEEVKGGYNPNGPGMLFER